MGLTFLGAFAWPFSPAAKNRPCQAPKPSVCINPFIIHLTIPNFWKTHSHYAAKKETHAFGHLPGKTQHRCSELMVRSQEEEVKVKAK